MDAIQDDERIIVRLDPGDSVMGSLDMLREDYGLENAFFYGLGAVDDVTLGHYDVEEQEYREQRFRDQFEVTNFVGNIGPDKIHAHITLGKREYSVIGGHCADATVSGTFELIVFPGQTPLKHRLDEKTGLDVFDI